MFLIGADLGYYVDLVVTTLSKPVYLHEYNVSIITRAGEGSRPVHAWFTMHFIITNRTGADKRASRTIAHSIIRPRENKVSRFDTGTVYSRHRAQVRLVNAISGPGTTQSGTSLQSLRTEFLLDAQYYPNMQERRRGWREKEIRAVKQWYDNTIALLFTPQTLSSLKREREREILSL